MVVSIGIRQVYLVEKEGRRKEVDVKLSCTFYCDDYSTVLLKTC